MSERIYPCGKCGTLRTEAEGGRVFTVCDDCWHDKSNGTKNAAAAILYSELTDLRSRLSTAKSALKQCREALEKCARFIEDDTCRHDDEKAPILRSVRAALAKEVLDG